MKEFIILILIVIIFGFIINIGLGKTEKIECRTWQKQAEKHADYYLSEWQKQQCDYHNIKINAPVK